MRNLLFFLLLTSFFANSQGFNYQAIVSDSNGAIVASQNVTIRLSIVYSSANGTVAYTETHGPTTDARGLINIVVGAGTQTSSGAFTSVDWSTSSLYLKTELDLGSGYVNLGTDLIGQVPIALFAKKLDGISVTSGVISSTGGNFSGTVTATLFSGEFSGDGDLLTFDGISLTSGVISLTGANFSGTVTATKFSGDGSGLTGVSTNSHLDSNNNVAVGGVVSATYAVAIGFEALKSNTSGYANSAVGYRALKTNTTGWNSTALGKNSLFSNTTGSDNFAGGTVAAHSNTTGSANTTLGSFSLYNNTIGYDNTTLGYVALKNNVSGDYNTAVGSRAGEVLNTDSNSNTFIGRSADTTAGTTINNSTAIGSGAIVIASNTFQLGDSSITLVNTSGIVSATGGNFSGTVTATKFSGDGSGLINISNSFLDSNNTVALGISAVVSATNSVAIGKQALQRNTSGERITAVGMSALTFNTTGLDNTGLGNYALFSNTSGSGNTAVGGQSSQNNTTGVNQVAIGKYALMTNVGMHNSVAIGAFSMANANSSTSDANTFNTAVGYESLMGSSTAANNTGTKNTALGYQSMKNNTSGRDNTATGYNALFSNTTGSNNTGIGSDTLKTNTTGSNNTALGSGADVGANNLTNATAIGNNAIVSASNKIRLGDGNVTSIEGQVSFSSASDRRLKDNIKSTKYGLETILKLVPVDYILKSNGLKQIGFIAQDIKPIIPEAVNGIEGDIQKGETLAITYTTIIPILTKAIQEQEAKIKKQNELIQKLILRIESLEK